MSYVLSPHSLNLYAECKKCFWQAVNEKVSRPSGPFPSLPSGMDIVLKTHFDSHLKDGRLPPALSSLDGEVTLFDDAKLLKKWRGREGVSWANPKGDVLKGSLDNLLVGRDGKLIVLDYKTRGFPLKPDTAGHYVLQMNVYNFLLRKVGRETADFSLLLFYYPKEVNEAGFVEFNTQLVKLDVDVSSAERRFDDALKTLYGKKPEPNLGCDFCAWAKKA